MSVEYNAHIGNQPISSCNQIHVRGSPLRGIPLCDILQGERCTLGAAGVNVAPLRSHDEVVDVHRRDLHSQALGDLCSDLCGRRQARSFVPTVPNRYWCFVDVRVDLAYELDACGEEPLAQRVGAGAVELACTACPMDTWEECGKFEAGLSCLERKNVPRFRS